MTPELEVGVGEIFIFLLGSAKASATLPGLHMEPDTLHSKEHY